MNYWDHSDFLWAQNILRIHGLADWRLRIVENIVAAPGFKQNDATGHYSGYCRREEKVIEILLDESRAEFHDTFLHELAHVWISGHNTDWQLTYEALLRQYAKP